jgi:hypothetical protein
MKKVKSDKETVIVSPPISPSEEERKACLVIISGNPLAKVFF